MSNGEEKEPEKLPPNRESSTTIIIATVIGSLVVVTVMIIAVFLYKQRKYSKRWTILVLSQVIQSYDISFDS